MTDASPANRQSTRFLILYALAVAGGAVAYVPFLTILLPLRVTELAGTNDVQWLAYATFAGAISASLTSILFGWLSDVVRNRRVWIWCGLIASSAALLTFYSVQTLSWLIIFTLIWQIALNMMLSPLAAWAGDCIPDRQKGMLGGLLSFAPALGALAGAIITIPGLALPEERIGIVVILVTACILPVMLFGKPLRFTELEASQVLHRTLEPAEPAVKNGRNIVVRMWLARLLIQICEATLFAYVLFWFRSIDSDLGDDDTAQILSAVVIMAVPAAIMLGKWADRHDRPIAPLAGCAAAACLGLLAMANAATPAAAIGSYTIFGIASAAFLSLHTSQTLRVLPRPEHRGRDMGIFNLTNTAPSLLMPWLVVILVPVFGFPALLLTLSVLAACAAILLWRSHRMG